MPSSRVLFVCTGNRDRSPTAERMFHNWKGRWEAKSAGTSPVPGRNALTQELVDWADLILVMESDHSGFILANFNCNPDKIRVLNIPDMYLRDDPELIREFQNKLPPILSAEKKSSN
jgi:predicted protein tyrosine phosphatase